MSSLERCISNSKPNPNPKPIPKFNPKLVSSNDIENMFGSFS